MDYSNYQQDIFAAAQGSNDNIIVNACPGSGKTTTLNALCSLLSDDKTIMYLAFNKAIVNEAVEKLPSHVNVLTLNSLGHRAVMQSFGRVKVDSRKVYRIIKDTIDFPRYDIASKDKETVLARAVAQAKMIPQLDYDAYLSMVDTYVLDDYDGMYDHVMQILEVNDEMTNVIDFNDQIRFPYIYNLPLPKQDEVLVDEAQDLNAMQAVMVQKLKGRTVLVGDRHQAIYGFRGAMVDSMSLLQEQFNAVSLPLKLTYRCAKAIVQEAQLLFPDDIEALSDADDGVVEYLTLEQRYKLRQFHNGDMILCRNTAPLVSYAYSLLQRKIPCHVRGRDIGEGIGRFIKGFGAADIESLIGMIEDWYQVAYQKAMVRDQTSKAQQIEDRYKICNLFAEMALQRGNSIDLIYDEIDQIFSQGKGVMLSTIHKAKGLESEQVYLLDKHLIPSKYAKKRWQLEQEDNLLYVAVTRAKQYLGYM